MAKKINYTGSSKIIKRICEAINDLIDGGGGGGGGSTVTISPTLSTGTKIADFTIDGSDGSLYAPSGGGGGSDDPRFNRTLKLHVVDSELHISGIAE